MNMFAKPAKGKKLQLYAEARPDEISENNYVDLVGSLPCLWPGQSSVFC